MKKYCNVCIYETLPYEMRDLNKGEILFLVGEEIDSVYLIESGYIKVLKYYESGDEKIFDIFGAGEFLGLLLLLQEKSEYIVTAIAITDTVIRRISNQDVIEAHAKNILFQQTCLRCATSRAKIFQNQLFQIAATDVDEKIIGVLMYLYHKFGQFKGGVHSLYLPINQTEIANIVGIRRETLSRRLKVLQETGVLLIENHIYYFQNV